MGRPWSWKAGDLALLAAEICAVIVLVHIFFVLIGANPGNDIVRTDAQWAGWLATWFDDLFQPTNEKAEVAINYGLATVFFLILGRVLKRVIDRL
jgi:hypothetical protein